MAEPNGAGIPRALPVPRVGRHIRVTGIVQAVGFRPFVYRLAREMNLDGRVRNAAGRVEIDLAGPADDLDRFMRRLREEAPPQARVEHVAERPLSAARMPPEGSGFGIEESVAAAGTERLVPPDIATCADCLREIRDPLDRRSRYPFTNCTNCGPRATIIEDLPYDRARTSMRAFSLCADCDREYRDPADRRFHAEPVACPACGPRLAYRRAETAGAGSGAPGAAAVEGEDALRAALADLEGGRIVAVKGLGGYHLACDASSETAVARLRDRKRRWAKPFAVMVRDLEAAHALARLTPEEERLLESPARPIVLVEARAGELPARAARAARPRDTIAPNVAEGNRRVGLFLPYTPIHYLLLAEFPRPIVLTSGNLSDEPLVTDDGEALARLRDIADSFLQHDREIRARYDDSVTRVVAGRESIVRRGRGYAPDPLPLPGGLRLQPSDTVLATGAELKHTFALGSGHRAYVSPHIGDLEDVLAYRAFESNLEHMERMLSLEPRIAVHDLHPSYLSTQFAVRHFPAGSRFAVQHHHAHVASCAAEHGIIGQVIGVAYDGLGMGDDGTFWGGELLVADLREYRRVARFGLAPMPGGAAAVHKPYRMALGYLFGAEDVGLGDNGGTMPIPTELAAPFLARLDPREVRVVRTQVARRLNAPLASSAGRLFDTAASLLGIRDIAEYEAQAAIELEQVAEHGTAAESSVEPLPYRLARRDGLLVYDPRPTLQALLVAAAAREPVGRLAARFHETIATVTRDLCAEVRRDTGLRVVCLSGGVLQNQWLAEALLERLARDGFEVHINRQVPVNDGGISYGQTAVAAARLAN